MASIIVYEQMVDTLEMQNTGIQFPQVSEPKYAITGTRNVPDNWPRRLRSYLTGGTLREDFKEDVYSFKTLLQFLAVSLRLKHSGIGLNSLQLSPTVALAAVPAIVEYQGDQTVQSIIDCEEAVKPMENGIVPMKLHPDGPYYCGYDNGGKSPIVPTCEFVMSKGGTLGNGGTGDVCLDNSGFVPFVPPAGGIPNPAPLVQEAPPAPTTTNSDALGSATNDTNDESGEFGWKDLTPHEKIQIGAIGASLIGSAGLVLVALVRYFSPQRPIGSGVASVSYNSLDEQSYDQKIPRKRRRRRTRRKNVDITGRPIQTSEQFYEEMTKSYKRIFTLTGELIEGFKQDLENKKNTSPNQD